MKNVVLIFILFSSIWASAQGVRPVEAKLPPGECFRNAQSAYIQAVAVENNIKYVDLPYFSCEQYNEDKNIYRIKCSTSSKYVQSKGPKADVFFTQDCKRGEIKYDAGSQEFDYTDALSVCKSFSSMYVHDKLKDQMYEGSELGIRTSQNCVRTKGKPKSAVICEVLFKNKKKETERVSVAMEQSCDKGGFYYNGTEYKIDLDKDFPVMQKTRKNWNDRLPGVNNPQSTKSKGTN